MFVALARQVATDSFFHCLRSRFHDSPPFILPNKAPSRSRREGTIHVY